MTSNNRFLTSTVTTHDTATETTQKLLLDGFIDGTHTVNIVGSGGDTVITDVNFTTSQTDDLKIDMNRLNGGVINTSNGTHTNSQRVVIASDNSDIPIKNGTAGNIIVDLQSYNFATEKGLTDNITQRVVEANDGPSKYVIGTNILTSDIGTLMLGVNTDVSNEAAPINVNDDGNILISSQQLERIQYGVLGINTFPGGLVVDIKMDGYILDVPQSTVLYTQVSEGHTTAGRSLVLPAYFGISGFDVVSTSVNDGFAGIGARQITVYYCDEDGVKKSENVTMTGTTPVVVGGLTGCVRILYAVVIDSGSSSVNQGLISIYITGGTAHDDENYEQIGIGRSISRSAKMYVPENKTLHLNNINIYSSVPSLDDGYVRIQAKAGDSIIGNEANWRTLYEFQIPGNTGQGIHWSNLNYNIITSDIQPTNTTGLDVRAVARKHSSGDDMNVTCLLTGYYL